MKNRMSDLNNHLFAQLERMSEENADPDKLTQEVQRADAIVALADRIVDVQRINLAAAKLYAQHGNEILSLLPQVGKALPPAQTPAQDADEDGP